eukprot:276187-Pelagomonas_calceolata.AAC.4
MHCPAQGSVGSTARAPQRAPLQGSTGKPAEGTARALSSAGEVLGALHMHLSTPSSRAMEWTMAARGGQILIDMDCISLDQGIPVRMTEAPVSMDCMSVGQGTPVMMEGSDKHGLGRPGKAAWKTTEAKDGGIAEKMEEVTRASQVQGGEALLLTTQQQQSLRFNVRYTDLKLNSGGIGSWHCPPEMT